jgi:hypothetical protein
VTETNLWTVFLHEKNHFFPGNGLLYGSTYFISNSWQDMQDSEPPMILDKQLLVLKTVYSHLDLEDARDVGIHQILLQIFLKVKPNTKVEHGAPIFKMNNQKILLSNLTTFLKKISTRTK